MHHTQNLIYCNQSSSLQLSAPHINICLGRIHKHLKQNSVTSNFITKLQSSRYRGFKDVLVFVSFSGWLPIGQREALCPSKWNSMNIWLATGTLPTSAHTHRKPPAPWSTICAVVTQIKPTKAQPLSNNGEALSLYHTYRCALAQQVLSVLHCEFLHFLYLFIAASHILTYHLHFIILFFPTSFFLD